MASNLSKLLGRKIAHASSRKLPPPEGGRSRFLEEALTLFTIHLVPRFIVQALQPGSGSCLSPRAESHSAQARANELK